MPFEKFKERKYPVRQWLLEGAAGSGKSSFAAQLRSPILTVDADHRWSEVVHLTQQSFQLSNEPMDNINPDKISALIKRNMHGSGVKTIVVDSLTAIIAPLVTAAIRDNDQGKNTNRVAAFKEKATAIRLLQDTLTGTGADVAWIFHIFSGRDAKAKEETKTSIPELELARILRSCNLRLRTVAQNGVYKIEVVWARGGRSGAVLTDDVGNWAGMPEKIEAAVYGGLSQDEKEELTKKPAFGNPEEAIAWGMEQQNENGPIFRDEAHAKNAYDLVKRARGPQSAEEMRVLWEDEIEARLHGMSLITEEERTDLGD